LGQHGGFFGVATIRAPGISQITTPGAGGNRAGWFEPKRILGYQSVFSNSAMPALETQQVWRKAGWRVLG
jgi:hypothetical protein